MVVKEPHVKGSRVADIILGGQDGMVNVLGLVLGLAAATNDTRIILAGGLAATFAESLSMAAVAFTSKSAERDHYQAEMQREQDEINKTPELEVEEIRTIYSSKGFKGKILDDITTHITSNNELWLKTMMSEELGLSDIRHGTIVRETVVVGTSTLIGSLLPLIPFFILSVNLALVSSLIISSLALIVVGIYKAKTTVGDPLKSAVQMVLIGLGAAFAGYLIGLLFRNV